MREIAFSQLLNSDVCVSSVSSVERFWKNGNLNEYPSGRSENILSYTIHGGKILSAANVGEPLFRVQSPAVFFITAGAPYSSRTVLEDDGEMGHTICVKFRLTDASGEEIRVSDPYLHWNIAPNDAVPKLFVRIFQGFMDANVNQMLLKSAVYQLLGELSSAPQISNEKFRGFDDIYPALQYIEANYSQNISVEELARMCFISNSCFRRRFKEYTGGVCFTDYRNRIRIQKAVELLESQLWTIESIAQTLGFYDASHFYRVYKKYTGNTPRG